MPLYEYQCRDCGTFTEIFTPSRHDEHLCEVCDTPMQHVMSVPHLHGSENMPNG